MGTDKRTLERYVRNYYSFLKFRPVSRSNAYFA